MTHNLRHDWGALLLLFVGLRLMLLITFQPEIFDGDFERGVTALGDFYTHYQIADTLPGLPYRDYWVEFPPVWPFLVEGTYALTGNFTAFANLLYLLLLGVEVGNLGLVRALGERLHGAGEALAWAYALFAAPLVMLGWNFESLVSFSLLSVLWASLPRAKGATRGPLMVLALAFGILTKYVPLLALPLVWKFAPRGVAWRVTAGTGLVVGLVLGGLLLWGGETARYSLTVQFDKPSYQTVWALLDGEYGTGSFPGAAFRTQTGLDLSGQPTIPGLVRLLPFAVLGAWLFWRPIPDTPEMRLAFLSVTLWLFMLWSQGWSPQWLVVLTPLMILNFPSRLGILLVLLLSFGALIEYPLLFRQSAGTTNIIQGTARLSFALLVMMRSVILVLISLAFIQRLTVSTNEQKGN